MKKTSVVAVVLSMIFIGVAFGIERDEFSGRAPASLAPVYQNDGDTFAGLSVSVSSIAWTQIVPSRDARRRLHLQVLDSTANGVCVSTISAAATACDDTTLGVELSTGAAKATEIDLYYEGAAYGRARAGSSGERLKGYETYDSGD